MDAVQQAHAAKWLAVGTGLLSMLSSSLCIAAYLVQHGVYRRSLQAPVTASLATQRGLRMKELLQGYLAQLMWLNVADWLVGAAFVMGAAMRHDGVEGHGAGHVSGACTAQALLIAVAPLCSAFWTCAMGVELWHITFRLEADLGGRFLRRRYAVYHALGWGLPVVFTLAAVFLPAASGRPLAQPVDTGSWCWYDGDGAAGGAAGAADPVWALYIPKLVLLLLVLATYTAVMCRVRCVAAAPGAAAGAPGAPGKWNALLLTFAGYPAVYAAVVLPPLLLRTSMAETAAVPGGGTVLYGWLAFATAALMPSQGTFNLLIFASTNRAVRRQLRRTAQRWGLHCACCDRRPARKAQALDQALLPPGAAEPGRSTSRSSAGGGAPGAFGALLPSASMELALPSAAAQDAARERVARDFLPSDEDDGGGRSSDEEARPARRPWHSASAAGRGLGTPFSAGGRSSVDSHGSAGRLASSDGRATSVQYAEGDVGHLSGLRYGWQGDDLSTVGEGDERLQPSLEAAMLVYGRASTNSFDLPAVSSSSLALEPRGGTPSARLPPPALPTGSLSTGNLAGSGR